LFVFGTTIVKSVTNPDSSFESGHLKSTVTDLLIGADAIVTVTYNEDNGCGGYAYLDGNGVRIYPGSCASWSVLHTPQNCGISWNPATITGTGHQGIRVKQTSCCVFVGTGGWQWQTPCCAAHSYHVTFIKEEIVVSQTGSPPYIVLVINGQPVVTVLPETDLQLPSCREENESCASYQDCCEGLVCEGGKCKQPTTPTTCASYGQFCVTTADCCSPYVCYMGGCYFGGP
jgi:hypothetical protein